MWKKNARWGRGRCRKSQKILSGDTILAVFLFFFNTFILFPCYKQKKKKKLKLAKELSNMVIYCKSVHFNGFEDARQNLSFYEMSSFKEGKAMKLAEESGEEDVVLDSHKCFAVKIYLSPQ